MPRFNSAEEVFAYYSSINGDFKIVEEEFKFLKEANLQQKDLIEKQNKAIAELTTLIASPTISTQEGVK